MRSSVTIAPSRHTQTKAGAPSRIPETHFRLHSAARARARELQLDQVIRPPEEPVTRSVAAVRGRKASCPQPLRNFSLANTNDS